MNRTSLALTAATAAAAAALALPATGSAHTAPCIDGRIVPDYLQLSPVIEQGPDGSATVRWSDGYTVQVAACGAAPAPMPVPVPVAVETPGSVVPTPQPVITPGPQTVGKPKPRPPKPTCAQLRRAGAGPRSYTRLGHYPGCVVPRTIRHPRRPPTVAVTG